MFNRSDILPRCYIEWYDPATKIREKASGIDDCRQLGGLGVISDQLVFAVGGVNESSSKSVMMFDVSSKSPSWVPMVDMLVSRKRLGVGVLDNCIYAVSYTNNYLFYTIKGQCGAVVTQVGHDAHSHQFELGSVQKIFCRVFCIISPIRAH